MCRRAGRAGISGVWWINSFQQTRAAHEGDGAEWQKLQIKLIHDDPVKEQWAGGSSRANTNVQERPKGPKPGGGHWPGCGGQVHCGKVLEGRRAGCTWHPSMAPRAENL